MSELREVGPRYMMAEDAPAGSELTIGKDGKMWLRRDTSEPRAAITAVPLFAGMYVEFPIPTYYQWGRE